MSEKIIEKKDVLISMFGKMDTDDILKDMIKTRQIWQKYDGISSQDYWLTERFKYALLELIKREMD
jgi:hypothetical protein